MTQEIPYPLSINLDTVMYTMQVILTQPLHIIRANIRRIYFFFNKHEYM